MVSTTPPGLTVRTPDEELPVAFPGDLLTIEVVGTLQVKNGNGSALVNLVLAGGIAGDPDFAKSALPGVRGDNLVLTCSRPEMPAWSFHCSAAGTQPGD